MNLRPGQIVILVAGVVLVIFSFLTFYGVDGADGASTDQLESQCEQINDFDASDLTGDEREQFDAAKSMCEILDGVSAWNTDLTFPLATWPAIIGLVVAGLVAASAFGNVNPPEVAGFSSPQLLVGLATSGALIMLGFLVRGTDDGLAWGIGFWFLLLGSLALLAGTVMELLQGPRPAPAPFGGEQGFGGPPPAQPGSF